MHTPSETSVTQYILGLKAGDDEAAQKLWEHYFHRLVRLARRKLEERQASRRASDEEDAALSAFKSLCLRAAQGQFHRLTDRDDLWRLLVVITARKVADQVKYENAEKRGGGRVRGESVFDTCAHDGEVRGIQQVVGDEPTPTFAAEVAEEIEKLLERLGDETLRKIALWRLEGYMIKEIAGMLGCSQRTVARKLDLIRKHLSEGAP